MLNKIKTFKHTVKLLLMCFLRNFFFDIDKKFYQHDNFFILNQNFTVLHREIVKNFWFLKILVQISRSF